MVQGDGSGQDLRPHLVVEVGGRDGVADGVGRPVRRAIRSPTEQIARLLTESFDADHDDPVKVVEKPLTKTAGTRTPLVLLAYVAAAAEENFDTMTRRRAHQPALTARWLSLVVIRVPRTDVETVVRDEAVTTANEDDPPDDEQPKSAAHRAPDLDHLFVRRPAVEGGWAIPAEVPGLGVGIHRGTARALTARALERPHLRRSDGSFTTW